MVRWEPVQSDKQTLHLCTMAAVLSTKRWPGQRSTAIWGISKESVIFFGANYLVPTILQAMAVVQKINNRWQYLHYYCWWCLLMMLFFINESSFSYWTKKKIILYNKWCYLNICLCTAITYPFRKSILGCQVQYVCSTIFEKVSRFWVELFSLDFGLNPQEWTGIGKKLLLH